MGTVSKLRLGTNRSTVATVITLLIFAVALVLPQFVSSYNVGVMTRMLILSLTAMSFSLLAGYGGLLSLAQALFRGLTAYVIAIGMLRHGWSAEYAILFAVSLTVAFSVLFGWIARGLAWLYFLMMSLAVGQLGHSLAMNWGKMTRGFDGIHGVPGLTLFNVDLSGRVTYFYFTLIFVFLCYLALKRITQSPFGIALQGVRDNPTRMASLGFNVRWQKHLAIVLSSFFASLSGVIYIFYYQSATPRMLELSAAVSILFVALLGGVARIEGGIIGAIVYVLIDDFGRSLTERYMTIIGVFFVLMVLFFPGGIVSLQEIVRGWLSRSKSVATKGVVPPKS